MGIGVAVRMYHNPGCATCRKVLALLRARGVEPGIVDYLKEPPSEAEWKEVLEKLDGPPESMLRKKEPLYAALGLGRGSRCPRNAWRTCWRSTRGCWRGRSWSGGRRRWWRGPSRGARGF